MFVLLFTQAQCSCAIKARKWLLHLQEMFCFLLFVFLKLFLGFVGENLIYLKGRIIMRAHNFAYASTFHIEEVTFQLGKNKFYFITFSRLIFYFWTKQNHLISRLIDLMATQHLSFPYSEFSLHLKRFYNKFLLWFVIKLINYYN